MLMIYFACFNFSTFKLLLKHKDLDVNKYDDGWTQLHRVVCMWGNKKLVKEFLFDARIDTTIRDDKGRTVLDIAIERGHIAISKIIRNSRCTPLLRIQNRALCRDIVRMIIEEYV